jgi:GntR family transcriptional repressor for pyruvate dehydrogenase complex
VSRSTVREALRLLASQNLIVTTRGVAGGSFVVHPSPEQLTETLTTGVNLLRTTRLVTARDILEARQFMEVPGAALAASRRTEADLEALRESLFDPHTAEFEVMTTVHSAFHEAMAEACGNPLLALISKPLHRIANTADVLRRFGRPFWVEVDADHRAIYAAVAAREPEQARLATARHIENLRVAIEKRSEVPTPAEGTPAQAAGPSGPTELAVSVAGGV